MKTKRDTSRDGFGNKLQVYLLTHFPGLWAFIQANPKLARWVNKFLTNNAIYKVPVRPYPFSLFADYTCWDSLTDRTYTGRHLPPKDWRPDQLPDLSAVRPLFQKRGETRYSEKSTLLFPYFVQWFTDGFLRTDRHDRRRNTSNHEIDMSTVYGLKREYTQILRSHQGGKLKSQFINGEEYPPFYFDESGEPKAEFKDLPIAYTEDMVTPEKKAKLFAMGVERANVQIGYVMLNVLALREHNRLCDLLAQAYPEWDDERLFQTARNILLVIMLKIVLEEYINHITPYLFNLFVDPMAFVNEKWHRQNWMTAEFTLVYRWHSALPETLEYDGQPMAMIDTLWHNDLLIRKGLGPLFEETSLQKGSEISLHNTPEFLIDRAEIPTLELERMARMASYNDYREYCGFPRVTDFDQITSDPALQQELKDLYQDVENIEFYMGLMAEDVRPNSALQPLMGRLVGIDAFSQALKNPLLTENVFNEKTFSPVGWQIIQQPQTLSDLLHRNIPEGDRRYQVTLTQKS